MAAIEENPATVSASVAEVAARVERPARGRQVVNALRQKAKDFVSKNTPSPLQVQLKRATHAESISVPKGAVEDVVKASSTIENRREIMRHLHACLAEESSALWRRVYLGLQLLEALLQDGPQDLIDETANGHHFDLVQRLNFLNRYEYSFDDRVESMIRRKAAQLREGYLQQQLDAEAKRVEGLSAALAAIAAEGPSARPDEAPLAPGAAATQGATPTPAKAELADGPAKAGPAPEQKARFKPFLNGVASVGHNDDTSDESDAEDGSRPARPVKRAQIEKECSSNASSSTCDVGSSKSSAEVSPREPQLLDLLGGWTETTPQDLPPTDTRAMEATKLPAAAAPCEGDGATRAPAAPCEDLLDMCSMSAPEPAAPGDGAPPGTLGMAGGDDLLLLDVDTTANAAKVNDAIFNAAGTGPPAAQGTDWLAVASSKGISFNDEVEDLI